MLSTSICLKSSTTVRTSIFTELVRLHTSTPLNLTNLVIGRTARIGNQGLATSFYSTDDEPMAPFLAKILVESGNEVPDFLEEFKPEAGAPIDFDDDSDDEEEEPVQANGAGEVDADGDEWGGAPAVDAGKPAAVADDSWGAQANGSGPVASW